MEALRMMLELVKDLQLNGFRWDPKRGCWVHPDGTEIWEDGKLSYSWNPISSRNEED